MDHAAVTELIAGRALGDLDAAEARVAEAHLRDCPSCRALTHSLDSVLGDLALAVPPRAVPPTLGPSILAAIRREATLMPTAAGATAPPMTSGWTPGASTQPTAWAPPGAAGAPERSTVRRWLRSLGGGAAVGLAAAAVVAIVVLGAQVADLRDQLAEAQLVARAATDQLAARDVAMQVVADPGHASAWLDSSEGASVGSALVIYRPGSTDAYLVANELPASPVDRVYQFWYADDAGVHAGVTFHHDGQGVLLIPVQVDLRGAQAAMLTLEPTGGSTGAPGQDIVFGELPAS